MFHGNLMNLLSCLLFPNSIGRIETGGDPAMPVPPPDVGLDVSLSLGLCKPTILSGCTTPAACGVMSTLVFEFRTPRARRKAMCQAGDQPYRNSRVRVNRRRPYSECRSNLFG